MAVFSNNYKLYTNRITNDRLFSIPENAVWARIYITSGSVRITGIGDQIVLPNNTVWEYGNMAARTPKLGQFNVLGVGSGISYSVEYLM